MKTQEHLTWIANKEQHPKKPIRFWRVKNGSQIMYEDNSVALCWYYRHTHGLKTNPIAVY